MLNRIPCAPGDVDLEERAGDRLLGGLDRPVLAGRPADPHERRPGVVHDRLHVGEVEVDQPGDRDDVADPLDALAQDVVDDAEGVEDRRVLLDDVAEAVVRDRDQRVDLGLELLGGLLGDQLAAVALEAERLGHDADREGAEVLGDLRDDRGRTRARAAAEAGRDEDHVGVAERLRDLLGILLRRALADGGVAAGAEAARDLVADADLVGRVRLQQRLGIGVDADELDAHHLGADHAVDGVASATADADHANEREVLRIRPQRHRSSSGLRGRRGGRPGSRARLQGRLVRVCWTDPASEHGALERGLARSIRL